jgi:hypothetical protein
VQGNCTLSNGFNYPPYLWGQFHGNWSRFPAVPDIFGSSPTSDKKPKEQNAQADQLLGFEFFVKNNCRQDGYSEE